MTHDPRMIERQRAEIRLREVHQRVLEEEERCIKLSRHMDALRAENTKLRAVADAAVGFRAAMEREEWAPPVGRIAWWVNEIRTALTALEVK